MTTYAARPVSIKQLSFISSLLQERPSYPYRAKLLETISAGQLTMDRASRAIDDLKAFREPQAPAPAPACTDLPERGTFTVVMGGERRTLRFSEGTNGFEGKTMVAYLAGPDNEADYVRFAHVDRGQVKVWKRFGEATDLRRALEVLASADRQAQAGEAYALESGRCYRCNRLLTVPASIHRGLGPDCAKRV